MNSAHSGINTSNLDSRKAYISFNQFKMTKEFNSVKVLALNFVFHNFSAPIVVWRPPKNLRSGGAWSPGPPASTPLFMKQNQDKFAGHRVAIRNKAMDVADDFLLQRVRMGSATKGREVMDECTKQAVQKKWNEIVTTKLGFQDYNAFREALKKEKQLKPDPLV